MLSDDDYKRFVSQFTVSEWRKLCKHRLFLHFLRIDLRIAASLAADSLQRPVNYAFPAPAKSPKSRRARSSTPVPPKLRRHPRFRL